MAKVRWSGAYPVRLFDGDRLVKPGDVVTVTKDQAAEMTAKHPAKYKDSSGQEHDHPKAGEPIRPGWTEIDPPRNVRVDTGPSTVTK